MAKGKNTIVRTVNPKQVFAEVAKFVDSTISYNQGDLLIWDATNKLIKIAAAEGDGATMLGVALQTIIAGQLQSPIQGTDVDASQSVGSIAGPQSGVVAKCTLKASDSLVAGQLVYLNPAEGARCVQSSGTKAIGVYQGVAVTGGPSATATEVEVLIGSRYPSDTLSV